MPISRRLRTWPSVLWQGSLAFLQCQVMICSAHSSLPKNKKIKKFKNNGGRERKNPFHHAANKQVYGSVWGSFGASLLIVCGL